MIWILSPNRDDRALSHRNSFRALPTPRPALSLCGKQNPMTKVRSVARLRQSLGPDVFRTAAGG
jgi:hypothetical protein